MKTVIGVGRIEWTRFFRDRIALFSTLLLPVVLVVLIGLSFGQAPQQLPVGVISQAATPVSEEYVAELRESPSLTITDYSDLSDMQRDVRMGLLSAGIVVPEQGSAVQVFASQTSQSSGAVYSALNSVAAEVGTRAVAVEVLSEEVDPTAAAEAVTAAEQEVPPITVDTETLGQQRPSEENMFASAVPSQLTLFVFLNGLLGAAALVQSRQLGVFRRTASTRGGLRSYVAGVGVSRLAIAGVQGVILLGLGVLSFRVDFGNPVAIAVVFGLWAVIASAAGMALGAVVRTPGQAAAVAVPVGIVAGMLGGCMWPLSVVSPLMNTIGHFTPHAWAMDAWSAIVDEGAGLPDITTYVLALIAWSGFFVLLAAWALQRSIRRG